MKTAWLLAALLALPTTIQAHHSRAAFALEQEIAVEGTVTAVGWTNPHFYLELEDRGGESWTFEGHSIPGLVRNGWRRDSIQAGSRVRVVARPNREPGVAFGLLESVTRSDGRTFYSFQLTPELAAQAKPPLQPSSDFTGTWLLIRSLRSNLVGSAGPRSDWPLTEQAREEAMQFDKNDDPSLQCLPRGLPRMLEWPYSQRWVDQAEGIGITIEHATDQRLLRNIPVAENARFPDLGVSVITERHNDRLVVQSTGFPPKHWGLGQGLSSSADKRLTETYRLADGGYRLELTARIEDPAMLTEPVEVSFAYAKVHDFEFAEEPPCDVATATRHLKFE